MKHPVLFLAMVGLLLTSVPKGSGARKQAEPKGAVASLDLTGPVAILPFSWADEVESKPREELPELPRLARETFAQSFAALPYEDMGLEQVDKALSEAGLLKDERWRMTEFPELASKLSAGTLIRGEVTEAVLGKGGLLTKTALSFRITLIDGKAGSLIWQGTGESSRRGGLLFRAGQAREIFAELSSDDDQRLRGLQATTKEAVRRLIVAMPPPAHIDIAKPVISSSSAVVSEGSLREIAVEIEGMPKCVATFDIGSFRRFIPLWEISPGVYRGGYIPQPGDSVRDAPIVFRLESGLGLATEMISEKVRITLP